MLPPLPRCSSWASSSLSLPSRISLPRKGHRVGLHIVLFEDCSAFTLVAACTLARSPIRDPLSEGFRHFVSSMPAPVASGGSDVAGWDLHPLESAAFHGAPPFPSLRKRRGRRSHSNGLRAAFTESRLGGHERHVLQPLTPTLAQRLVAEHPLGPQDIARNRRREKKV